VSAALTGELDRDAATLSACLEGGGEDPDGARERFLRVHAAALERLDEFRATGVADLGPAYLRREGRAGVLELRNPRHLNAEDDTTLAATEVAVDLALLDPEKTSSSSPPARCRAAPARPRASSTAARADPDDE
jgi:hypothetical protein